VFGIWRVQESKQGATKGVEAGNAKGLKRLVVGFCVGVKNLQRLWKAGLELPANKSSVAV
jgi:hypothetical protein